MNERPDDARPPGTWSTGAALEHLNQRLEDFRADVQGQLDRRISEQKDERKDTERHLENLITKVEEALQQHIVAQVEQVRIALVAAQEQAKAATDNAVADHAMIRNELAVLDRHRDARLEAVRNEMLLIQDAAREATVKAETSFQHRFVELNKVRQQQQEDRGLFITREAVDAKFEATYAQIDQLKSSIDKREGGEQKIATRVAQLQPWQLFAATTFLALIIAAVNIVIALV